MKTEVGVRGFYFFVDFFIFFGNFVNFLFFLRFFYFFGSSWIFYFFGNFGGAL